LPNELHRVLFSGVREHAGKSRAEHFGAEFLNFGPNRSSRRHDVPSELEEVWARARRGLKSFDDNVDDPAYSRQAIHFSVWLHAELIRIHPFEDGNGRVSRLVLNASLVRLGLRPVAVEACKQEYYKVLNHFLRSKDLEPAVNLFIRLMASQLPAG